jgi:hypothetical protein
MNTAERVPVSVAFPENGATQEIYKAADLSSSRCAFGRRPWRWYVPSVCQRRAVTASGEDRLPIPQAIGAVEERAEIDRVPGEFCLGQ